MFPNVHIIEETNTKNLALKIFEIPDFETYGKSEIAINTGNSKAIFILICIIIITILGQTSFY